MSNPYVQVELDALKKAPLLASALGVQLRDAVGGLTLMWAHVYTEKVDTITAFYLRVFFGVDAALVAEALEQLGFVDRLDATTWRVRGAGRYTRLSEVRSEAGRKGAAKTNARSASAAANTGEESASAAANDPDAAASDHAPTGRQVPRQTFGKDHHEAALAAANGRQNGNEDRQKTALEPIADIASPTEKQSSTPRVRAPTPAPARKEPEHPPPDPRVLQAIARWQKRLSSLVPHGAIDDESLLSTARDFAPDVFDRGVEHHVAEGPQFWVKAPLRYLRLRCEWARDKPPPKPQTPTRRKHPGETYGPPDEPVPTHAEAY